MPRTRAADAPAVVYRSARIAIRTTALQRNRCYALLRSGGDVWSWVLDHAARRELGEAPIANYQALCGELTRRGNASFGELSSTGARSILRRYADAWMTTAKKRRDGELVAHYPRRKRSLVPSRYYAGTFAIDGRHLRLPVARGASPLVMRLARELPYGADQIRSVTLLHDANRLFVEISAEVAVQTPTGGTALGVAGIDLGIIGPFAVASDSGALIVSGRALRAESRLHLADQKARRRAVARRAPAKGMRGSRRWRKYKSRRTRTLEARHRRRLSRARHEAARAVIDHATEHGIGTLVVGDPRGLLKVDAGIRQNHAVSNWRVGQWISTLEDKAEVAGITVQLVDERGTSSTCPRCRCKVPKPRGRNFTCPHCELTAHRDVVGAANIAAKRGGTNVDLSGLTVVHRRAGRNLPGRARRDRRRVAMQLHRRGVGPGPAVVRPVDLVTDHPGESLVLAVS